MIKYKYIVQLIQAHFAGDKVRFLDRAEKVAKELEREGGRLQAQAILREVDFSTNRDRKLCSKGDLKMKLTDYILHLQYLHSKCGDVDVMNKTAHQRKDRSYKNEYTDVKLAHYESTKQGLVVVIHEDFIPYIK